MGVLKGFDFRGVNAKTGNDGQTVKKDLWLYFCIVMKGHFLDEHETVSFTNYLLRHILFSACPGA